MVQLLDKAISQDPLEIAIDLSQELAKTAVERDIQGGSPRDEIECLRQSGLLKLMVPKQYGGLGETSWPKAYRIIRELAKADGSVGQLFGNHNNLTSALKSATPKQQQKYCAATVEHNWFWANAANARDLRLVIQPEGDHFRLKGIKSFCTGARVSDVLMVGAVSEKDATTRIFAAIPTSREGLTVNDDWDNMGQRRTDSSSVSFDHVLVEADEIFVPPYPPDAPIVTLRSGFAQLIKVNVYLGIAQGVFAVAQDYTRTTSRAWMTSGVDKAAQDPYILHHYGELWVGLQAAAKLADDAAQTIQAASAKGPALTAEERADALVAVFTAKTFATRVGLEVTNRIFELTGSRATAKTYGLDRYWRDLRTFTLHDPLDYKIHDIGNWVLNRQAPPVTAYS